MKNCSPTFIKQNFNLFYHERLSFRFLTFITVSSYTILRRLLLTILFKVICNLSKFRSKKRFLKVKQKKRFKCLPGGKVDIKDIVWPGEVLKPPEGVPERGFLTVTFLEVRLSIRTQNFFPLQTYKSAPPDNFHKIRITSKSSPKLYTLGLGTFMSSISIPRT